MKSFRHQGVKPRLVLVSDTPSFIKGITPNMTNFAEVSTSICVYTLPLLGPVFVSNIPMSLGFGSSLVFETLIEFEVGSVLGLMYL